MLTPEELERRGYAPDEIEAMLDAEREGRAMDADMEQEYYEAMEEQAWIEAEEARLEREREAPGEDWWEDYSDSRRDL